MRNIIKKFSIQFDFDEKRVLISPTGYARILTGDFSTSLGFQVNLSGSNAPKLATSIIKKEDIDELLGN